MSGNEEARRRTAGLLAAAASSASGSRRRSTAPTSTRRTWSWSPPGREGTWPAATSTTSATETRQPSVGLRKIAGTGEYVFFLVDPKHPRFELVKNVVASQSYVAEFVLHDYP